MKFKIELILVALLISGLISGCGKKQEPEVTQVEETDEVVIVSPEMAASVSGTVMFEGEAPAPKLLPIKGNPECSVLAHGEILSEDLLVQDGKLKNVFVYVKDGLENQKFPAPSEPVEIDNTKCIYIPHVAAAQVNQPVKFKNNDPTLHNIHAFPKNQPAFNVGLPFEGMKVEKKFSVPEVMIPIKCDVHPWMLNYTAIVPHPYFAVTGEDGSFNIKNLPPGKYVLEAWHETLGTQELPIEVGPQESKTVNFTFKK